MNNGTLYWFLSEDDYDALSGLLSGSGFTLDDFPVAHHETSGSYKGYYFDLDQIDTDEMEWLTENCASFDQRVVNLSVQAGWSN